MSIKKHILNQIKTKAATIIHKRGALYDWSINARAEQIMPNDFHLWMIMAGRGFGKTRTGSESIRALVKAGYKNICILGETMMDTRKVMVEGKSGILSVFPPDERPRYYPSRNLIEWHNGTKAHLFSGEQPDSLRGPQFDAAWIDELAKFHYADACWDQIMMSVRLGKPKIIITTTPKNTPLIRKLTETSNIIVTRGSTLDNQSNLSPEFIQCVMEEYANTRFGKQEIYGELLDDNSQAVWLPSSILYKDFINLDDIVIGVDPAVTNSVNSDETGIIVAGRDANNEYYIIGDYSGKFRPQDWASLVVNLYYKFNASCVVIEVNQGGDLATELIAQCDATVIVEPVRAVKSKVVRAQPVAALYDQKRVFHIQRFFELELQMLDFHTTGSSPDRVDALVWALSYLKKNNSRYCIF